MKQIHPRKRAKMTGKGASASFFALPHYVIRSPQWCALSGTEKALLIDLGDQYNGVNNGDLGATWEVMKRRGWNSKTTLFKALDSLEKKGWIITTRQGGRHIGCSLYAITWLPIDDCSGKHDYPSSRKPSNSWKNKTGGPVSGL